MFYHGKLKPKAGTLVIFPATWTYNHKGAMPLSGDKYVITGWVSNKDTPKDAKPAESVKPKDAKPKDAKPKDARPPRMLDRRMLS